MAQTIAYLEAVVGADITTFRRGMQEVRRELGILSDTASGFQHLGRNLTFAVTTPLLAAGGGAVKMAADFEAAMRNVASISSDVGNQFDTISEQVREFGMSIRSGPQAAAEALYQVVSAGVTNVGDAMHISQIAAKTAEAGLADLTTTAVALTGAMLGYNASIDQAAWYSDVLTRTVQVGVGDMNAMAGAFGAVTSTAAMVGVEFDDVGAALAFLTQRNLSASEAGTALNGALKKLLVPTEEMSRAFEMLGVASGEELIDQFGGLAGALSALRQLSDEGKVTFTDLFNEVRALKAAGYLTDDLDVLAASFTEFGQAIDGATDRAHQEQMKSFWAQLDLMKSAASGLAISVGNALTPVLVPLIQTFRELFLSLAHLPPEVIALGVAFGALVAAIGPLSWLFGSLLASLTNPMSALLIASGLLVTAIATDFGGIRTAIEDAVNNSLPALGDLKNAVLDFFGFLTGVDTVPTGTQFGPDMAGETPPDLFGGINDWFNDAQQPDIVPLREIQWFPQYAKNIGDSLSEYISTNPPNVKISEPFPLTFEGPALQPELVNNPFEDMNGLVNQIAGEQRAQELTNTLGGRLQLAIENSWPQIQSGLARLKEQAIGWFINEFLPKFDTWGADILTRIAGSFSGTEMGDTDLYATFRDILNGDIGSAIEDLDLVGHLPKFTAALQELFDAVGKWIQTDAIPALGNIIGYGIGRLGAGLRQAITDVINGVSNADGSALGDSITNFGMNIQRGYEDAMADVGHTDASIFDTLLTTLAGLFVANIALTFATKLVTAGLGSALSGAVGAAIGGIKILLPAVTWVISLGTTALSGLAAAVSTAIGGSLAVPLAALAITLAPLVLTFALLNDQQFREEFTEFLRQQVVSVGTVVLDAAVDLGLFVHLEKTEVEQSIQDQLNALGPTMTFSMSPGQFSMLFDVANSPEQREALRIAAEHAFGEGGLTGQAGGVFDVQVPIEFVPAAADMLGLELPPETLAQLQAQGVTLADEIGSAATTEMAAQMLNLANTITQNENLTPDELAAFATRLTGPIADEFTAKFGPDGTVRTTFTEFAAFMGLRIDEIKTKFDDAVAKIQLLQSTIELAKDPIIDALTLIGTDGALALTPLYNMVNSIVLGLGDIAGGITGLTGGGTGSGSGMNLTPMASGGRVTAGMMTYTGERGIEPFIPGSNGTIIPTRIVRDALRGGSNNSGGDTYIINAYGSSPYELARMTEQANRRSGKRYN